MHVNELARVGCGWSTSSTGETVILETPSRPVAPTDWFSPSFGGVAGGRQEAGWH